MRGRKPIPTPLKVLRGNPGRRPLPQDEPQVAAALPAPPPHLGSIAHAEWARLALPLQSIGVLTAADWSTFAAYCQLYEHWALAEQGIQGNLLVAERGTGAVVQNPLIRISHRTLDLMHKYMVELGLTPSSRTRIKATKPKEEDALESFLGGKKKGLR